MKDRQIEWSMTTSGVCKQLDEVPHGAIIEAINDIEVVGMCEICGKPVLDTEKDYWWDDDGNVYHEGCYNPDEDKP